MKSIQRWIRNYFHFTPRETNGFILLLLFLTVVVLIPFLWEAKEEPYNTAADQQMLDSLAAQLKTQPYSNPYPPKNRVTTVKPVPPDLLRPFDPNKLTQAQWEQLGLPAFVAKRLIKYRDKANGFRYKDQIGRIYGFPPGLFVQLEPYIVLPDKSPGRTFPSFDKSKQRSYPPYAYSEKRPGFKRKDFRLQPFDINTADTVQLKQIRGIGSKLSARILKFRNKLGGFEKMQQLQEVYGLPAEVVDSLRKYTFISNSFRADKLDINTATLEQLRQHPYLGFALARHIIAYRTQHGAFSNLDELRNIKTLDEATFQKIMPYLTL